MALDIAQVLRLVDFADLMADTILDYTEDTILKTSEDSKDHDARELVQRYKKFREGADAKDGKESSPSVQQMSDGLSVQTDSEIIDGV